MTFSVFNPLALGIDIGGTRVRVGMVRRAAGEPGGEIIAFAEDRLPTDGAPEPLRALVARLAREVGRSAAGREIAAAGGEFVAAGGEIVAAGVALPGVWDRSTGIMQRAVNLPLLEGTNLYGLFAGALGRAPLLEADVNAAIVAQHARMDPAPRRLLYLSIGTGVGGSVLLDGQLVRHTRGGAGHFGFLIVDTSPGAPAGRNEVPGCLSAIVAGPALHYAATGQTDLGAIGDEPLPAHVLDRAARALSLGLLQLVHIYAPEVILLGGGVIDHHPELIDVTRSHFAAQRSPLMPPALRIERAPLSTREAGVIGAALLALERSEPQP